MSNINLPIKKLDPSAVLPKYNKEGDAGLDLVVNSINKTDLYIEYGTDLAFEIPKGHVGLIFQRSSVTNKPVGYDLKNAVGVIDSTYRGEVTGRFNYPSNKDNNDIYNIGDKFLQMIVLEIPYCEVIEVSELSQSERGINGYGSSGK